MNIDDRDLAGLGQLRKYVSPVVVEAYDAVVAAAAGKPRAEVWDGILAAITDRNDLLLHRRWRFSDRRMLPVLLEEILGHHEYFAETNAEQPRILDCGANFGLATYFFLRSYRNPRVEAYEPNPAMADIIALNLERNKFDTVQLHRAAISDRDGVQHFYASRQEDAASSLIEGRPPADAQRIEVQCVSLASLLHSPVALLKLDVEGVEAKALAAAGAQALRQCETIICETHALGDRNTLLDVLSTLDAAGFEWAVARALWDERGHRFRFARTIGKARSYCVFARRKD